jgi:VWFA-related protein
VSRTHRVACVALAALLAAMSRPVVAQNPSPSEQPTFRVGVDLVVVEVLALDKSGSLAEGLTPADFKVEIGGDPREVATVDFIAGAKGAHSRTPASGAKADAGPDVSVNTDALTSRRVLIVVDQASLGPDSNATLISAARRWLKTLDPTDRVGLVSLPPPGPLVEFTTNHRQVDEALTKVMPVGGVPPAAFSVKNIGIWEAVRIHERDAITRDLVIERECYPQDRLCPLEIEAAARDIANDALTRVEPVLGSLRNMLRAMRVLPGPKHAVLLSAGWPIDPQSLGSKLEPLAVAAASANVILHTIATERSPTEAYMRRVSPTFVLDRNMLHAGVETLAGWTGGDSHRVTGNADVAFAALNRMIAGYYRLGVRPAPEDLDGKAHRISVKVTRPGVTIRSHRKVIAIDDRPVRTEESDPEAALSAALVAAAPQTGLALRATSYFLHEDESAPDRLRVLAAAEITGAAAGPATVRLGLFDESGHLVAGIDRDVQIPTTGPGSVSAALHAPPGVYSLRIAARDREGRVGTVQRDVDLQWHAVGSVKTTGLALFQVGASAGEAPVPVVDSIPRSERLIAQLAFTAGSPEAPEPSPVLEITAEGGSAPLLRQPIRVSRMEDGRRWLAQQTISMSLLPPGSYTVSAQVAAGVPPLRRRIDVLPETPGPAAPPAAGATDASGAVATTAAAASTKLALASLAKPAPFDPSRVLDPARLGPVLTHLGNRPDAAAAREALQRLASGPWPMDPAKGPLAASPVAAHFVAGIGALQAGDLEAAAVQFRLALRVAPDFGPAMAYLAACYAAGGKHKEAAGAWQAALVRERESPWLQQLAIEAWLRAERPATALALAKQGRQRFPEDESFARLEVTAALAEGDAREGLEKLESLRNPDASLMLMALATLYTAAKDGTPIWDGDRDLAAMRHWRDAYAAADGESLALVNTWMAEVSSRPHP